MKDIDVNKFYLLVGGVQHYAWGMRANGDKMPYIAEFLQLPAGEEPWAELWLGAHPKLPSSIAVDGQQMSLEEAIAKDPSGMIGTGAVENGGILPFLLKVLSCSAPLSIQSHPDRKTARHLHAIRPEWYPDDNHKPEMMLALTEFEAMCGLRGCSEIEADLTVHPALKCWVERWENQSGDATGLKGLCQALFDFSPDEIQTMCRQLQDELQSSGCNSDADQLFLRLLNFYPNDRGVFFAYLLNHITLQPGEAVFVTANQPHAYLNGTGVECMANSDNVIRAGLTPKVVDVSTLMSTLDFFPEPLKKMRVVNENAGICRYVSPIDEFELTLLEEGAKFDVKSLNGQAAIILVLEGEVKVADAAGNEQIARRGQSWFKPAAMATGKIECGAGTRAVIASSNL